MTPLLSLTVTAVIILISLVSYIIGRRQGHDDAIEEQQLLRDKPWKKVNGQPRNVEQWQFKPRVLGKQEPA